MYQGKTISVALASYNGAQYLQEQLDSIVRQTVVPDEIVISDDGSKDRSLEIAEQYALQYRELTRIAVLRDNPRHGIGGNFEWAIRHTSGDCIFICGQDDVWRPEKVAKVMDVFLAHPEAEMVCHNLSCIGPDGAPMPEQTVNSVFLKRALSEGEAIHVSRAEYLDAACCSVLISGPAVCISRPLTERCLPIPPHSPEDWWLQFCAVADDRAYYLHLVLTDYRIHDSTCHSVGMGRTEHLRKSIRNIKNANQRTELMREFAQYAEAYLRALPDDSQIPESALGTLARVREVSDKVAEAAANGRIKGAVQLTKLYRSDIRYRRIGRSNYLTQLGNILFTGKSKRRKELGYQ